MSEKSRWTLPQLVHPPGTRRFVICVPDERFYVAAFQGLLVELTYSKNWQRDEAHTAAVVSRVWQQALANVLCDDCGLIGLEIEDDMQLRIKPTDPCIIQTLCGDGTWMDWYNPKGCIPGSVTQPGPVDQPAVGECLEFDVALTGNGLYHLPVPVSSNDTIEITGAVGGWHDGNVGPWYCPNGQSFLLGGCVGSGGLDAGDPAPTIDHMRLIALLDGVYYDAYNTTITVPTGLALQDMVFQANDDPLTDNSGSISFHIKYCHNIATPAGDCLYDDFTDNDGGWANVGAVADFGTYISSGTKHWESDYHDSGGGIHYEQLRLYKAYVGHISQVTIHFDADQAGYMLFHNGDTLATAFDALYLQQVVAGNNQTIVAHVNADAAANIRFDFARDLDATSNHFRVYSIEVCP